MSSPTIDPNVQIYLSIANILVAALAPICMVFLSRVAYSECCGGRIVRRLSFDTARQDQEDVPSVYQQEEEEAEVGRFV